jgi:hypothetical protein
MQHSDTRIQVRECVISTTRFRVCMDVEIREKRSVTHTSRAATLLRPLEIKYLTAFASGLSVPWAEHRTQSHTAFHRINIGKGYPNSTASQYSWDAHGKFPAPTAKVMNYILSACLPIDRLHSYWSHVWCTLACFCSSLLSSAANHSTQRGRRSDKNMNIQRKFKST